MDVVVIATGESLTKEQVSSVKRWRECCGSGCCGDAAITEGGHRRVIAVSDAWHAAPWADALVSQDQRWWQVHEDALTFAGQKFCGHSDVVGVCKVPFTGKIATSTNSGLLACHVAETIYHAKRIFLLGIDLRGTHYFGPHPEPLRNTSEARFGVFKRQFREWEHKAEVVNCAPGSGLDCFPRGELDACLGFTSQHAPLSA